MLRQLLLPLSIYAKIKTYGWQIYDHRGVMTVASNNILVGAGLIGAGALLIVLGIRKNKRCSGVVIAGAGRGLLDSTVDYAISTGNKFAASSGGQSLTEAGEALASDLAKSALPKVEVPKKKKE